MPIIGITGGIATGKTTFVKALLRHLPATLFDADACAHDLLENDPAVRESVNALFGADTSTTAAVSDSATARARLRELVFSDRTKRAQLEAILHPAIRSRWRAESTAVAAAGGWFLVDIPLLFETGAESYFDRVIVVACAPGTQRARLRIDRGLSGEMVEKMIASQLDLGLKMLKADHVIWNDFNLPVLEEQTALLVAGLHAYYG